MMLETHISLWALLFILYIGVVWITILVVLRRIEKLLKKYKSNCEGSTPSNTGEDFNPSGRDV